MTGITSSQTPAASKPDATQSSAGPRLLADYLTAQPARGNATDAVTDALREAILDGALPTSTWLREEDLARELSVSRTPVREALRRLADEGLTQRVANRGSVVAPMTLEEILAVYSVRESLEALAARTAAQRRSESTLQTLNDVHAELVRSADAGDIDAMAKSNLTFHRAIREMAGNPYLDRFLIQVEQAVRRFGRSTLELPDRVAGSVAEHQAILDAIAAGDTDAAEQAALTHIRNARRARVQALVNS